MSQDLIKPWLIDLLKTRSVTEQGLQQVLEL